MTNPLSEKLRTIAHEYRMPLADPDDPESIITICSQAADELDRYAAQQPSELLQSILPAIEAIESDQKQADEDGIFVTVSRQAVDEICAAFRKLLAAQPRQWSDEELTEVLKEELARHPAWSLAPSALAAMRRVAGPAEKAEGMPKVFQWQPMETAPKDGTKIIVWTIHEEVELTEWYCLSHFDYEDVGGGLYRRTSVVYAQGWNGNHPTHWMPVPAPPAEQKEIP